MRWWEKTWKKRIMLKWVKSEKRQYETEWYQHNKWVDKITSQKDH